jgi:hypothetical protein
MGIPERTVYKNLSYFSIIPGFYKGFLLGLKVQGVIWFAGSFWKVDFMW